MSDKPMSRAVRGINAAFEHDEEMNPHELRAHLQFDHHQRSISGGMLSLQTQHSTLHQPDPIESPSPKEPE